MVEFMDSFAPIRVHMLFALKPANSPDFSGFSSRSVEVLVRSYPVFPALALFFYLLKHDPHCFPHVLGTSLDLLFFFE